MRKSEFLQAIYLMLEHGNRKLNTKKEKKEDLVAVIRLPSLISRGADGNTTSKWGERRAWEIVNHMMSVSKWFLMHRIGRSPAHRSVHEREKQGETVTYNYAKQLWEKQTKRFSGRSFSELGPKQNANP